MTVMYKRAAREILSYVAVAAFGAILAVQFVPSRRVAATQTPATAIVATAPAYARTFMRAFCARDVDEVVKYIHPRIGSEADIRAFEAAQVGARCLDPQYFGAYRTQDTHIFTVFDPTTGTEVYYVVTFEGGLVVNIE